MVESGAFWARGVPNEDIGNEEKVKEKRKRVQGDLGIHTQKERRGLLTPLQW